MAETIFETEKSPTPPTFQGLGDVSFMKHIDANGEFVEESDPRAAFQVNPDTEDGKATIARQKAQAKAPEPVPSSVASDPAPTTDAKIITSDSAKAAKEVARS